MWEVRGKYYQNKSSYTAIQTGFKEKVVELKALQDGVRDFWQIISYIIIDFKQTIPEKAQDPYD